MALEKTSQGIVAYTARHRIEGEIILLKGEKLSDKLNGSERQFEAIENARVFALDGGALEHQAACLALNKSLITLMVPVSEP